jgi:hypothetical protein
MLWRITGVADNVSVQVAIFLFAWSRWEKQAVGGDRTADLAMSITGSATTAL